jgi:hypothetical protein
MPPRRKRFSTILRGLRRRISDGVREGLMLAAAGERAATVYAGTQLAVDIGNTPQINHAAGDKAPPSCPDRCRDSVQLARQSLSNRKLKESQHG